MSNEINTLLLERASEMITMFEGKLPAQVIEQDLVREDLEALNTHVCEAEALAAQNEIEGSDVY